VIKIGTRFSIDAAVQRRIGLCPKDRKPDPPTHSFAMIDTDFKAISQLQNALTQLIFPRYQ